MTAADLKPYLLFAGSIYYPRGGWEDFQCAFGTLEEAKDFYDKWCAEDGAPTGDFRWGHIYGVFEAKVVAEVERELFGVKVS